MTGFIALHREAKEHPLFVGDAARFGAWFWMVATACWKPTRFSIGGTTITLDRGQLCVSRAQLAKAWGWSPSAVERFLTRLQTEQMIERETGQGRSIVTICNYEKYQDISSDTGQATGQATGQPPDSHRTTKEQGNKGTRLEEEANASPSGARDELDLGDEQSAPAAKPKRKRKASGALPAIDLPDWMPVDAWNGFIEMRLSKGAKPTERAMELIIRRLDEFRHRGHDPTAVLDQSTRRRWTDVYELKDDQNANRSASDRRNAPRGHRQDGRDGFERALDADLGFHGG